MATKVGEIMLSLSECAVADEGDTILEALEALRASQEKLPPDRHPHRAIPIGQRVLLRIGFGLLDASLYLANRIQVVVDRVAIFGTEGLLQTCDFIQ